MPSNSGGVGHVDPTLWLGNALEAELEIGQHRQMGKQAGFLEHVAQRALVRRDEDPVGAVLPDFIVDLDKALIGPLQCRRCSVGKWSCLNRSGRKVP